MVYMVCPKCIVCGNIEILEMSEEQAADFKYSKKYVQDIFPDWPASKREMLISGTHPECWQKLFPPEEELDENDWEALAESGPWYDEPMEV